MYSTISESFNNTNWNYLRITDELINSRYKWVNVSLPIVDNEHSWAHEHNIIRLFIISRTFLSKEDAVIWMKTKSIYNLDAIHLSLLDHYCCPKINIQDDIDSLIDKANNKSLLIFIQLVLDRSLLWYDPESGLGWTGCFQEILRISSKKLQRKSMQEVSRSGNLEIEGVDFVSLEDYTHVFYKFKNLINGLERGEVYYDIQVLSKQVHGALLKSMQLFFEDSYYCHILLPEIDWERKLNEIIIQETDWCKFQLSRLFNKE
ncbi:hypothetical protein [Aureibacter tunicatorum]|uniref:Uncharacterized protein n=1 Tax=Aureibacter tunicatorum TaxID=866807 RepID=A0AAE3XNW4_9BACT|nr:hypothetical protein [Aureibacter tunicatorum]MDR6240392.1 hypothetical protein [Aureibacter tunicatorum]BDD05728.1 hypothetical protein AUTU_32110 [Aureibacter tunicatorum]